MNARDALRRLLEQRREAGERDLVLDRLRADDVSRLVGARPATESPRPAADASVQGDWRAVLREAGVAPDRASRVPTVREPPPLAATPTAKPASQPVTTATTATLDDLPAGITVDAPDRELFGGGPLADLDSVDAVARAVASCTRCPLHATATNPVPGTGNHRAQLMVVGEAPGASEDEQGLPFVGAAGQLLTKILAAVDLAREDVFICNVLKHRPPGNRNPLPDEVTACRPFLARQFELIKPKVIVALGTFAAQTLLETKLAIGKLRGQLHRYHGVPLIVTYHPAALLRNPSWKRPTWEDVQLARRILDRAVAQP